MKFVSIIAVFIGFAIFFAASRSSKTYSVKSHKALPSRFLTSVSILTLRLVRGILSLGFIAVGFVAFRILLKELTAVGFGQNLQSTFDFPGFLEFLSLILFFFAVLYLIYRVSGRLRTTVDQLYLKAASPNIPLKKSHWFL